MNKTEWGVRVAGGICLAAFLFTVCMSIEAKGLSSGRVYEMVSPPYKGGYSVQRGNGIMAVAAASEEEGNRAAFFSFGSFADAPNGPNEPGYLAQRKSVGWSTKPLVVPAKVAPAIVGDDLSTSLDESLTLTNTGANYGESREESTEGEFHLFRTGLPDIASNFEHLGPVIHPLNGAPFKFSVYDGASADFCHLLLGSNQPLAPTDEEALAIHSHLYELNRGCGGETPSIRFVAQKNDGTMINRYCRDTPGIETGNGPGAANHFNDVADTGSEVFFTADTSEVAGECTQAHEQLFMRLGGARTVEVSRSFAQSCQTADPMDEVPCEHAGSRAGSIFMGANEAGTEVYFMTNQSLAAEDTDTGGDLYMARIGCPGGETEACATTEMKVTSLLQVSHDPTSGQAANVRGVVRVAPDGSRAYFVAGGQLLDDATREALEAEERPLPRLGAENLYVFDVSTGKAIFIADLCSGPRKSGVVEDLKCPTGLGEGPAARNDRRLWEGVEAQSAGHDAGYLVFNSYGQLLPDDTDTTQDVYRYDAANDTLERVSTGENGHDTNGNDDAFDAAITPGVSGGRVSEQYELRSRAISEDGSTIVFTSVAPLSRDATNKGIQNVYEWHKGAGEAEGRVSLISSGTAEESDGEAVITPSGRDIFFTTVQGLAPQDTDGVADVYDARIGGGFPSEPIPPQHCASDACQGPLTDPAPLFVPGSFVQTPELPFKAAAPVKKKVATKPHRKKSKVSGHRRARRSRTNSRGRRRG